MVSPLNPMSVNIQTIIRQRAGDRASGYCATGDYRRSLADDSAVKVKDSDGRLFLR